MAALGEIGDISITVCGLCGNAFNEAERTPMLLTCFHIICHQCLDMSGRSEHSDVICPMCQELSPVTSIVRAKFPEDEFFLKFAQFIELASKPDSVPCSTCDDTDSSATTRCLDCEQYLCDVCKSRHGRSSASRQHRVVSIQDYINMPEEFFHPKGICRQHGDMTLSLFCENQTCARAICPTCAVVSHKTHAVCSLENIYQERKAVLDTALTDLTELLEKTNKHRQTLYEQNETLDAIRQTLLQDIDESYNVIIEKLFSVRNHMHESVIANVEGQKAARKTQLELSIQSESDIVKHIQRCQLASQCAGSTQFINMTESLVHKAASLTRNTTLTDMCIDDVPPNLDAFYQVERVLVGMSQMRSCTEVTDAMIGRNSDVVKVTLLPVVYTEENKKVVLQASIQAPGKSRREVQPAIATVSSIVGSLRFKPEALGSYKTFIGVDGKVINDGIAFRSKNSDEKMEKRVIFGYHGQSGRCRELLLPSVELDGNWLNWKDCSINNDGDLTNTPTLMFLTRLTCLKGVTAKSTISGCMPSYWQVGIHKEVLMEDQMDIAAVEVGISLEAECDSSAELVKNRHAWCVSLGSCRAHNSDCLWFYSRAVCLGHVPMYTFRLEPVLDVDFGILLDTEKKVLHVIHVQSNKVVCSIPDVDVSQPLVPLFGVYSPTIFKVRVRVESGTDLTLSSPLLHLLSDLVQIQ
ncbi:protein PML-like [Gigantopelta aegis]|uniref:protein PML-like n=1 Tax=Gigantopelta aegis TaxID=1735272 RepID=UPI001B88A324|nr:protein PML-like [Gigantopelta aegis]XP_041356705.1 protein PML-like [Gigantopelta aegis]XP_041356717.1 protein PML-like [Gigantopelta aegis]